MNLLILSDTHGNYPLAVRALDKAGRVDRIIHLGDDIEDARLIEIATGRQILKVPGNCDLGAAEAREIICPLGGRTVLMTHGDRHGVKSGLANLLKRAKKKHAKIVLYGHTHVAAVETIDGILFVNPGSLRDGTPHPSYAILTITPEKVSAEIFLLER